MVIKITVRTLILIAVFWSISCLGLGYLISKMGTVKIETVQIHNHNYGDVNRNKSGFAAAERAMARERKP